MDPIAKGVASFRFQRLGQFDPLFGQCLKIPHRFSPSTAASLSLPR